VSGVRGAGACGPQFQHQERASQPVVGTSFLGFACEWMLKTKQSQEAAVERTLEAQPLNFKRHFETDPPHSHCVCVILRSPPTCRGICVDPP
jgi:hypothetical protein